MQNNYEQKLEILKKVLGNYIGKLPQIQFYCIKCKHHKKKLSINLEEEIFHCWVCNYKGTVYNLLKSYASYDLQEEWKKLSNNKYINVNLDNQSFEKLILSKLINDDEEIETHETVKWNNNFIKISKNNQSIFCKNSILFLNNRGISYNTILKYNLHYCEYGEFSNRIIIPSYDENGNLNYWTARSIFNDNYKYKNSKCEKDKIIFNDLFISWNNEIRLVEGPFDSIKNDINAIPILGSALSQNSKLFKKILQNKPVVNLIFDKDKAGKNALINSGKLLLEWDIETYYTDIGNFKDPGEMSYKEITEAINNKKKLTDIELVEKILE